MPRPRLATKLAMPLDPRHKKSDPMEREGWQEGPRLPERAQVDRGQTRSYTRPPLTSIMLNLQRIISMQKVSARWWPGAVPLLFLAGAALAAPGDQGAAPDTSLASAKRANLSPQEVLAQSRDFQSRMQNDLRAVSKLQDEAQKRKDVIKLNCVNDKLTQIRGHIAVADRSITSLEQYVQQNDVGGRQHEFIRMTILYQKVEGLKREAYTCVGEDIPVLGVDQLLVEVDPNLQGDPAEHPPPRPVPPGRPPEQSPFR